MHKRLYWREVGQTDPASSVSGLYGDHQWVQDLDIVNELGGHTGCVNALRCVDNVEEKCARELTLLAAGPSPEGSWLPAPTTPTSSSIRTNRTTRMHHFRSPPRYPPATRQTSFRSSSCPTRTIAPLSPQPATPNAGSSTSNTMESLLWLQERRAWPL